MNPFLYKILTVSFFLSINLSVQGQASLIDSLNQKAYETYREDVAESKLLAYRALKLSKDQKRLPQMVDSYINLSRCFRLESNLDSAFYVLDQALLLGNKENYLTGLMNASNNLAIGYMSLGEMDSATHYFRASLNYARQKDDTKGQANAFNNLAIIAQNKQANDSAIHYLNGALTVYEKIGDSSGISRTFINLAYIFDNIQRNEQAIEYNFKALKIQERLGLKFQQVATLNQIGDLYVKKAKFDDALKQYQKALKLVEGIGDIEGMANAYANVGGTLHELERKEEAFPYLKKGLELARQSENASFIGGALVNLGNWYVFNGKADFLKAETAYLESIPYLQKDGSSILSNAYTGLGTINYMQKRLGKAEEWFHKGLESARYFQDLKTQQFALKYLGLITRENRQLNLALNYSDQYHAVKDSLVNLQSLETINELNIEYESEKKEKENLELQNDLIQSELKATQQTVLINQILAFAGIGLLFGLGGFIWFRYRQRIRMKEKEMELEQERARQEQKRKEAEKLRELDAMKTRFFTNISHEFRTPLTLILGQNEQLQTAVNDENLKPRFQMVDRNGHRLLDLVNQVLDVAKLEAGGMTLEPVALDAIPFLKHIFYSFESMAEEKNIDLEFVSVLETLDTAFDTYRMERVFFNLLSNAFKFTPKGGSVKMTVEQQAQKLKISIRDTGVGIKQAQIPYLFDRFYQADSSDNQSQPGTGIGLSLVKELVELHGGKVYVESELNQGTAFSVELPIPENLSEYRPVSSETQSTLHPEALPSKNISETMEVKQSEKADAA
ncbi:MAG: tetratricopeptide repeat protein, partial [Bacteroidetes bacterium]|nr:tetratricopeptide repeat protein [Bacteroidota bacterium]